MPAGERRVAIDMESGAVARTAAGALLPLSSLPGLSRRSLDHRAVDPRDEPGGDEEGGRADVGANGIKTTVPFIVIRAIADPAERAVPPWVMQAVTTDGRTAVRPVLSHLGRKPGDLPALVRLALDARAAMRTLRRVAALAGPFLAFDR